MANAPDAAKEKRPKPIGRRNAQGDHEGSAHRPEEFLKNPTDVAGRNDPPPKPKGEKG